MARSVDIELRALIPRIEQELKAGQEARLYLRSGLDGGVSLLWSSGEEKVDNQLLLQAALKRQRPVLIHDASKHSLFRGSQSVNIGSALCVPVFDSNKLLLGLLSLTAKATEAFTREDGYAWERVARTVAPVLTKMRDLEQPPAIEKEESAYNFLYNPITLILAALLAFGLLAWGMAPGDKPPLPHPSAVPQSTYRPREVADLFLQRLQRDDLDAAWSLFDPSLQRNWSRADFEAEMARWLRGENSPTILAGRQISQMRRAGDRAEVILHATGVDGDTHRWTWTLVRAGADEWQLSSLDGPVKSPNGP